MPHSGLGLCRTPRQLGNEAKHYYEIVLTAVRLIIFIAENDRVPERSAESQDPGEIFVFL